MQYRGIAMMEAKGKRPVRAAGEAEKVEAARESVAPAPKSEALAPIAIEAIPAPVGRSPSTEEIGDLSRDTFAALAESQAALARGLDAISVEAAGLARRGIDAAAKSATEMLAVRTIADAIEVNAGLARRSFEACVAGSARFAELGIKLATDAAEPLVSEFGRSWLEAVRFGR
jgi:hypothetical protein